MRGFLCDHPRSPHKHRHTTNPLEKAQTSPPRDSAPLAINAGPPFLPPVFPLDKNIEKHTQRRVCVPYVPRPPRRALWTPRSVSWHLRPCSQWPRKGVSKERGARVCVCVWMCCSHFGGLENLLHGFCMCVFFLLFLAGVSFFWVKTSATTTKQHLNQPHKPLQNTIFHFFFFPPFLKRIPCLFGRPWRQFK